jgi:hypothetical protein
MRLKSRTVKQWNDAADVTNREIIQRENAAHAFTATTSKAT